MSIVNKNLNQTNAPKQNARQFEDAKSLKLLCWQLELDPQIEPGDLVHKSYCLYILVFLNGTV